MCFFGYAFTVHRMSELCVFTPPWTDWATKDQPEVSAGSVESIQEGFRGDQWLPDGGKVLCIPFPPPHRLPGGCSAAGAESAGMSGQRGDCINMCLWNLIVLKLIFIFLPRGIILNMVFYTVDLATVLSAVLFLPSVKDLQEELEKQESSLRKFGAVTHQLLRECHPSVSDSLNNALKDVNARWSLLTVIGIQCI